MALSSVAFVLVGTGRKGELKLESLVGPENIVVTV